MPTFTEILAQNDDARSTEDTEFLSRVGVAKSIFNKGAKPVFAELPGVPYQGTHRKLTMEGGEPEGTSITTPNATSINASLGQDVSIDVPERIAHKDVKTSVKSSVLNSKEINDRERQRVIQGKKVGSDIFRQFVRGTGASASSWFGLPYWLGGFAGYVQADGTRIYANDDAANNVVFPKNPEQKLIATANDTPGDTGNRKVLDGDLLNEFNTLWGDQRFTLNLMDKKSFLAVESILDAMPGNVAEWIKMEEYGHMVLMYKGQKYIRADELDKPIDSSFGVTSADGLTLSIDVAAEAAARAAGTSFEAFTGIDDAHIGYSVTLDKGGANEETLTIADIDATTPRLKVTLTSAAAAANQSQTGLSVSFEAPPRILAGCMMEDEEGLHFQYGSGEDYADGQADLSDEYAPIVGVTLRDAGILQVGGRFAIDHIDAYMNFGCGQSKAVASLQGYALPA